MESIRTAGLEIAYERAGRGPPIFLLHGAFGNHRLWKPQIDGLAEDFTVVAWDEPGAGGSSDLPAEFGLPDYARCLAALIEEVGLGPGHIAGLSWGGVVAIELHAQRSDLVESLILADTYAGWKGSLPAEEVSARVEGVHEMLAAPEKGFERGFPGLFGAAPSPEAVSLIEQAAAGARLETMRVQIDLIAHADQRRLLPLIAVPTLLIWGEDDARSPLTIARQFNEAIVGSELVVIPGSGHMSNLERPDLFNAAVGDFCGALASD
jgi:pimeloyl-ACP methyl ester carboxylesterase